MKNKAYKQEWKLFMTHTNNYFCLFCDVNNKLKNSHSNHKEKSNNGQVTSLRCNCQQAELVDRVQVSLNLTGCPILVVFY